MSNEKIIIVSNSSWDPMSRERDTSDVNFRQMLQMLDKYAVDKDGTVKPRKQSQVTRAIHSVSGEMPAPKFRQFLDNIMEVGFQVQFSERNNAGKTSVPLPSNKSNFLGEKEVDHYDSNGVAVYKFDAYVTVVLALLRGHAAYVGHMFKKFKFSMIDPGHMKTGSSRALARYLINILQDTEFYHHFDKMVINVSWSVKSFLPVEDGEFRYVKKEAVQYGDICELHNKSDQTKTYVTVKYEERDSIVLLYLKYFALFRLKSKSNFLNPVPRGDRLFDPELLFKIICCK